MSTRIADLWPYLPAFRAIAETEHLPRAAAQLHVVPSALSRSLRLLEEAVGAPLFSRAGGRLKLNQRGRALLEGLRQGMRAVERGVRSARGEAFSGELRVGTLGLLTHHVVLPELLALAEAHPQVVPVMRNLRAAEANHRLALGDIDVAFYYDAVPFEGVAFRRLGALTSSVYCGRGHPLFGAARVDQRALRAHPFSVPQLGDRNTPMDGWPVGLERKIGFRIELLVTNLEVCLSGRFLTVLPDVVAAPHLRARALRRFAPDLVPPVDVYGACREGDVDTPMVRGLIDAVAARVARVARETRSR